MAGSWLKGRENYSSVNQRKFSFHRNDGPFPFAETMGQAQISFTSLYSESG